MTAGPRVAGRYEIVRPLGHGAMATVDLARDLELDRQVALKRLAENLARDADLERRFLREARLAARLAHPNVVRVFDVGEDDGRPFIAMEYVDGETLAELLARRGAIPATEVAQLGVQICAGLAAAHSAGLVHRDVKPQNLLLGRDGVVKLGDFGIAAGLEGTRLTLAGTVLGTAGYLAPEQARGERVTAAADIYGVGAVLYELLAGEPLRTVGSLADLQTAEYVPPDLAVRVPHAPPELVTAVTTCLAPRPEDRPPSAAALARLLVPTRSEAETLALPDPNRQATEIRARPGRTGRAWDRRRMATILLLVAMAVAGLVVGLVVSSSGGGSTASRGAKQTPHAVAPPVAGASVADQARNLAAWLRAHSH